VNATTLTMIPEREILYFCLLGGLVAADNEAAWQTMFSQPLIACSVAGLLFGNLALGWSVGLIFQVPFLVELPAGGAKMSFHVIGAYVACGVALTVAAEMPSALGPVFVLAVLYGLLISWLGMTVPAVFHKVNLLFLHRADDAASRGDTAGITRMNLLGLTVVLFGGILMTGALLWFGFHLAMTLFREVPLLQHLPTSLVKPVLVGAGLGSMVYLFAKKRTYRSAVAGAAIGALVLLFF